MNIYTNIFLSLSFLHDINQNRILNVLITTTILHRYANLHSGLISVKDATNCLLELNIRGSALGEATPNMNDMTAASAREGDGLMNFADFIQHYAFVCELDSSGGTENGQEVDVTSSPLLWIPTTNMGKWSEVSAETMVDLYKEAVRYAIAADGSDTVIDTDALEAMPNHVILEQIDRDLTVRSSDIGDILLGAGVHQSATVIGETIRKIRVYLIEEDLYNFQELLAIFVAVRDDPTAPVASLGASKGAMGDTQGTMGGSSNLVPARSTPRDRPFSKPSRPQHGILSGTLDDPFSSGVDESVMTNTRMDSPARNRDGKGINMSDLAYNDPRSTSGGVDRGWKLPFRKFALQSTEDRIATEFRRLDLQGEGRLRYLNLKAALEAREVYENDATIRQWLKESDRGGKGYVDYSDYKAIYETAHDGMNPIGVGVTSDATQYGTLDPSSLNTRTSALARQANSSRTAVSEAGRQAALEKRQLLKRAFAKYDW